MSLAGRNRNLIIAILAVPALIYIYFFYQGARSERDTVNPEQVPQSFLETGTPFNINDATYRAGAKGHGLTHYNMLKSGNNSIMPEPGLVFAVVTVLTPSGDVGSTGRTWTLIDDTGRIYRPLTTDPGRLTNLTRLDEKDILPSTRPEYLVFKVREGPHVYYLKLNTSQQSVYWRLNRI